MIDLKSNLILEDKELKVGDIAPDFLLTTIENKIVNFVSLKDFGNKIKLISTFPSIDTGVCDFQTKEFAKKIINKDNIVLINVSCDLPFAFSRWCLTNQQDNLILLSDYKDHSFAKSYGINIKDVNLIYRAFFILDENNKIIYIQKSQKLSEHLNYLEIEEFLGRI